MNHDIQSLLRDSAPYLPVAILRKYEWTMGNGQCHLCYGNGPAFKDQSEFIGHHSKCLLATALRAKGEKVEFKHKNRSKEYAAHLARWNKMCDDSGFTQALDNINRKFWRDLYEGK